MDIKKINFKNTFIGQILQGQKTSTIRRETDINKGELFEIHDTEYSQNNTYIATAKCLSIHRIEIHNSGYSAQNWIYQESVTKTEGFENLDELINTIGQIYKLPFKGVIIKFELINRIGAGSNV